MEISPGLAIAVDGIKGKSIWRCLAIGHRLGFLVTESERTDGLFTRKLLLESANHNVVTAYSGKEGVEMYKRFLNVDAVCIEAEFPDLKGATVAASIKEINPKIRIIGLSPRLAARCEWADNTIDSHDPNALMELLQEMGGRTDI